MWRADGLVMRRGANWLWFDCRTCFSDSRYGRPRQLELLLDFLFLFQSFHKSVLQSRRVLAFQTLLDLLRVTEFAQSPLAHVLRLNFPAWRKVRVALRAKFRRYKHLCFFDIRLRLDNVIHDSLQTYEYREILSVYARHKVPILNGRLWKWYFQ